MKTFALALGLTFAIGAGALSAGCGGDDSPKATTTASQPSTVATAGGVVADQASVDLGRVPLDRMITQTWHLRNEGSGKAQLGKPKIEALEGC